MRRLFASRAIKVVMVVAAISLLSALVAIYAVPFDESLLKPDHHTSTRYVDRHGYALREVLSPQQTRARWLDLSQLSPQLIAATLAAEDKRFYSHWGVDPVAILRSFVYNTRRGGVVTGASTVTQQVVKLVRKREGSRVAAKAAEAIWALRLERARSKAQILEQYVNRVPYGNQLYGVGAASWMYFDKPPAHLTLAESAMLACIPRSPTRLNPYKPQGLAALERCQRDLLGRMQDQGAASADDVLRALAQPITFSPRRGRVLAPHFSEYVLKQVEAMGVRPAVVHTTLDLHVQEQVQGIVSSTLARLKRAQVGQAAVVVLGTQRGEVLAWVGAEDYWDEAASGANDGVLAKRQPGSALKPFVYGALLMSGVPSTQTFLDGEVQFNTELGAYIPENYDKTFHGPVSMRVALASSLNIPAVLAASQVGVEQLLETLRGLGLVSLDREADFYGLGLALGNGEVRLLELAGAYAALGRGGRALDPVVIQDGSVGVERQVFDAQVSAILLDMLSDDEARAVGFGRYSALALPYRVAAKTGTSADYRDNWAVGVTPEYTVAVWAGNFDGAPMVNSSGVTGAAPIMRQVFQALYPDGAGVSDVPWFERPDELVSVTVCALSGQRATARCPHRRQEWMRRAQAQRLPEDEVHVLARVDVRNGLLAGEECPPALVEERLVHRVPPAWLAWAHEAGLMLYPDEASPLCSDGVARAAVGEDGEVTAQLQILHPLQGDVFILDPEADRRSQQVKLRAQVPASLSGERLSWFVDGLVVAKVRAPFEAMWTLEPGEHVVGLGVTAPLASVRVVVQ